MNQKIKNFRDLEIWQLGRKIVTEIYKVSDLFPTRERYGLQSQLRRAAISIPSNIAEGFTRIHNKGYKQFLYIALGSCAETETQVEICLDLGFIEKTQKESLLEKLNHESRMIQSLINCLA